MSNILDHKSAVNERVGVEDTLNHALIYDITDDGLQQSSKVRIFGLVLWHPLPLNKLGLYFSLDGVVVGNLVTGVCHNGNGDR